MIDQQIGALFVQIAYIGASAAFILGLRGLTDLPALSIDGAATDAAGQRAIDFDTLIHAQAALPLDISPAPVTPSETQ